MKNTKEKEWILSQERPKVLFLGNGLFYDDCNWDKFIEDNRSKDITETDWNQVKTTPYTIRATLALDRKDDNRYKQYRKALDKIHENLTYRDTVAKLLNLSTFNVILTTNYSYQIEWQIDRDYCQVSDDSKRKKFAKETFDKRKDGKYDTKYLLRTYNQMDFCGVPKDVWHIHGETRRPSSIVATHDEYGKLMEKVRGYCKQNGYRYQRNYNNFIFKSWIDYLIMADVYFVGSSLDYTEFDLWWLLSRRSREKAQVGKMIYFEPQIVKDEEISTKEKSTALKILGVEWKDLGFARNERFNYDEFYDAVINELEKI